jgi:cysteine desulfurase family protein
MTIYLDNAATSYPKPKAVIEAVVDCMKQYGANPGRGGYQMAMAASRIIFSARRKLSQLFQVANSENIIFTNNATQALNLAIKGCLSPGDHVITTTLEHNSVLRPLAYLKQDIGIEITKIPVSPKGEIDLSKMAKSVKPNTKLFVINHASNVTGAILPLKEISKIAKESGAIFLVDAAQTAGFLDINVEDLNIDMLAFTGHKALLGPQGSGGLYISPNLNLRELEQGGTGTKSAEPQPLTRPERYESGTPNTPAIAGLRAALDFLREMGISNVAKHEIELTKELISGLKDIRDLVIYGPDINTPRVPVVSFNIKGKEATKIAFALDKLFDIACRAGLHCAPDVHQTIGTIGQGAVRFSLGYATQKTDIIKAVDAVARLQAEL